MSFGGNSDEGNRFVYNRPPPESISQRQQQRGGAGDKFIDARFPEANFKEGTHRVRILPPTWKGATTFGLEVFVNFSIGPDNSAFLSRYKMLGPDADDPIRDERMRASRAGDDEYADSLKPSVRVLYWLIDRDKEAEGPQLWCPSWGFDKDLAMISVDRRTKESLYIDDPYNGYDLFFDRDGTGLKTKYVRLELDRSPSPLHDDERLAQKWLRFVQDHPLPSVLLYPEPDYIRQVFKGKAGGSQPMQTRSEQTRSNERPSERSDTRETARDRDDRSGNRQSLPDERPSSQRPSDLDRRPLPDNREVQQVQVSRRYDDEDRPSDRSMGRQPGDDQPRRRTLD